MNSIEDIIESVKRYTVECENFLFYEDERGSWCKFEEIEAMLRDIMKREDIE